MAPTNDLMNSTDGLVEGGAQLTRQYPLLRKLGRYSLSAATELLGNVWDFLQMGLPRNIYLRIPLVYTLPPAADTASFAAAYSAARQAIMNMYLGSKALWPLDRDEEFIYYGSLGLGPGRQDFHPVPGGFCNSDPQVVHDIVYGADQPMQAGLIDRIQGSRGSAGVPKDMANRFITLYQYVINNYQRVTGQALSPQLRQQLKQNIDVLGQFLATLP